ncbi:MAG: HlyD family secretion protein [Rhodopirellula sp. JB044]|uniref:HlyD family secretion protein n=1 Tax=Rhodopirellula sp. JB044 TaxID=3342844 RepID=UPI00370C55A7
MNPSQPVNHGDPRATAHPVAPSMVHSVTGTGTSSQTAGEPPQRRGEPGASAEVPSFAPEMRRLRDAAILSSKQFEVVWHPLLTEIAAAPNREVAAERLVARIGDVLPDHTIRLGWGTRDEEGKGVLQRLHDSRLGWLGADNSVYQSIRNRFEKIPNAEKPDAPVRWESANLVLDLTPHIEQSSDDAEHVSLSKKTHPPHGLVWIRPPQDSNSDLKHFAEMVSEKVLTTTATVFFSRSVNGQMGRVAATLSRWWSRRGTFGIAALFALLVACIPVAYRIPAPATVTAMNSRRVAAPIDATLLTAHVEPGDHVRVGDPLLELDGRPLRIELEAITAEIAEATKDEDIALASGEIAKSQLAGLKRKSLSRRRDLITRRLEHLVVTSPIDGIVIQGDLHHSLGTPLETGQTLLEIAPDGSLEVELEIPEVEIGFVSENSPVEFYFPAVGRSDFYSQVKSIWPSATIRDDQNVFIAKTAMPSSEPPQATDSETFVSTDPVTLVSQDPKPHRVATTDLRVGMRGEAVVLGPTRPWVWRWVRVPLRKIGWVVGW